MDLSIIIVNWNVRELLLACLASIERTKGNVRCEVIVVDNASSDGSSAAVHERFPEVRLLPLTANIGFARANNRALHEAHGRYIFFLNPDTEVLPGCLERLVRDLDQHPERALVAPQIVNPDGTFQKGSIRRDPTILTQFLIMLKVQRFFRAAGMFSGYYCEDFDPAKEQRVDQPMGAALCVRRSVLDRLGSFDEHFFLWFEEVDLCKRIRSAGDEIWYDPLARVIHHGGQSFRQRLPLTKQLIYNRSALHYFLKHHGIAAALLLCCAVPFNLAASGIYQIVRKHG